MQLVISRILCLVTSVPEDIQSELQLVGIPYSGTPQNLQIQSPLPKVDIDSDHGKKFVCSKKCPEIFDTEVELIQHRVDFHSGDRRFTCKICDVMFLSCKEKVAHYKKCQENLHKIPGPFKCEHCGAEKETFLKLKDHIYQHKKWTRLKGDPSMPATLDKRLGSALAQCEKCGQMFPSKTISRHFRNCTMNEDEDPNILKCDKCEKVFHKKLTLSMHKLRVHNDTSQAKYKCETCGMLFMERNKCKYHAATHNEERNIICDVCGKTFKTAPNLQTHKKVMHLTKKLDCPLCEQKFALKNILRQHINSYHLKKPTYYCSKCKLKFSSHAEKVKHAKSCHLGEFRFECSVCKKGFDKRYKFRKHLMQDHSMETKVLDDGGLEILETIEAAVETEVQSDNQVENVTDVPIEEVTIDVNIDDVVADITVQL